MNNNKNSFISNVKVRGFSYLNGGTGPSATVINGQSNGQGGQNGASNGVSNGVSNGGAGGWESAQTSNGEGGEGKNGTEARTEPGRIGDFMKKKEAERKKEEKTSGCVMSEFMSVRDSKFTSLGSSLLNAAPALTPRYSTHPQCCYFLIHLGLPHHWIYSGCLDFAHDICCFFPVKVCGSFISLTPGCDNHRQHSWPYFQCHKLLPAHHQYHKPYHLSPL